MSTSSPHFLLFSESCVRKEKPSEWRFVLESLDGTHRVAAADSETETPADRLELLAVVRGLEALEQPSKVTLVTKSRYVSNGFQRGLNDWKENNWRWERFGRLVSVRNADLWKRIDSALSYHAVNCRTWRFDSAEGLTQTRDAASHINGYGDASEPNDSQPGHCIPEPHFPIRTPKRNRITVLGNENSSTKSGSTVPEKTLNQKRSRKLRAARRHSYDLVDSLTNAMQRFVPKKNPGAFA